MDFVLWKPSKPGEPAWPSPAGIAALGRPGWHIECSAMSQKFLGERFDIHGGGIDLVFPHHENERAQSYLATRKKMARFWMHNGFLQVEGEKMSKSLGNFVTIRELLETNAFGGSNWDGNVLRLAMLMSHYRQPIDWTVKGLELAFHTLDDWFRAAAPQANGAPSKRVIDALCDDLNTPKMLAEIHAIRKRISHNQSGQGAAIELANTLAFLGFQSRKFFEWLTKKEREVLVDVSNIESLIEARNAARKAKDFAEADRIRGELSSMGIELKDSKDGTTWKVAR
jgi:cysteinyl-tRNA synthetase